VITSLTLLTRKRFFWAIGAVLGIAGLVVAVEGFLSR
jgi:hypothetical protein